MGQEEVYLFLKRNRDKWFSAEDMALNMKIVNIRTLNNVLCTMEKSNQLLIKYVNAKGNDKRMFCYKEDDNYFDTALTDYKNKQNQVGMLANSTDTLLLMQVAQNKKVIEMLNKLVKNKEECVQ